MSLVQVLVDVTRMLYALKSTKHSEVSDRITGLWLAIDMDKGLGNDRMMEMYDCAWL